MTTLAAGALRSCLADLAAAANVEEFRMVRPSSALLDEETLLEISLTDEHRLRFRQNHINCPTLDNGSINWLNVSRIKIVDVDHA